MWVQTERGEFNHNDIKRLNDKYDVSSNVQSGIALAVEHKIIVAEIYFNNSQNLL